MSQSIHIVIPFVLGRSLCMTCFVRFAWPLRASMNGDSSASTSHPFSRSEPWSMRSAESLPTSNGGSVLTESSASRTSSFQSSAIANSSFQSSAIATSSFQCSNNTPAPTQPFQRSSLPPAPAPALNIQHQPYSGTVAVHHGLPQQDVAFPTQPTNYQQPQYTILQPHNPANAIAGLAAPASAHENLGHSMIQLSKRPRFAEDGKHLSIVMRV